MIFGPGILHATSLFVPVSIVIASFALFPTACGSPAHQASAPSEPVATAPESSRLVFRYETSEQNTTVDANVGAIVQARLLLLGVDATVATDANELTVKTDDRSAAAEEAIDAAVTRPGEMSLHFVAHQQPVVIDRLLERAIASADVRIKRDSWSVPSESAIESAYLHSSERSQLNAALAGLELPQPLAVLTGPDDSVGWRSFVVAENVLTGLGVASAKAEIESTTKTPIITIQFDEETTSRFANLTKTHVGHRLAIVVDQTVVTAPIIASEIDSGTIYIKAHGATITKLARLAAILTSGPLIRLRRMK